MKKIFGLCLYIVFGFSSFSQDTFSIVAIDTLTGEVGSAGASCVFISGQGVRILSDVHPGVGAIHTQAYYRADNQAYGRSLMIQGLSPQQIVDSVVTNDAQGNPTLRQYGVVDFRDGVVRSAGYTGVNCDDYKNHILGPNYAIQGNILLGQHILDSMEARFLAEDGELVCKLMAALQGAKVVGADTRCIPDGISSIGSFLRVAQPDDELGDLYLDINIPRANEGVDPIDSLQSIIDDWGGCTSIGIEGTEIEANVFPNPVHEILRIEFEEQQNGDFLIFNQNGQVVYTGKIRNQNRLDVNVSDLPVGIYLYNIKNYSGSLIKKGKFQKL